MRFFLRIYKFWLFSFKRMSPGLVLPSTTAGKDGGGAGGRGGKEISNQKTRIRMGIKVLHQGPPQKRAHTSTHADFSLRFHSI